jgi:uncharacterized phage protein (TIGR01671 family)
MREIKFRAWQHSSSHMLSWREVLDAIRDISPEYIFDDDKPAFAVMQFTGLNDKSGREIYEGDIISLDGFHPQIYEIKFIEGAFCACRPELPMPIDCHFFEDSIGVHSEVIGNIYENPELLEKRHE